MFFTVLRWVFLFFGGFLLGLVAVLLIKVKKSKKVIFKTLKIKHSFFNSEKLKIEEIVNTQRKIFKKKNRFHVFKTVIGFKPKTNGYFAMYGKIIREVAKLQNPESTYPLLEFSINQAFDFINSITVDLEDVVYSLDMPMLENLDLSTIYGFVDIKKKIDDIRAIKAVKKIAKPINPLLKIFKLLNPINWITTLIRAIFTASLTRDLIFAFADIVAWEFYKFYHDCKAENESLIA